MESLGLSQKDAQSRNKWRRRIKGQPANPGPPGKMAIKTECVCVSYNQYCGLLMTLAQNDFEIAKFICKTLLSKFCDKSAPVGHV